LTKRCRRGTALVSAMVVLTIVTFLGSSLMTLAMGGMRRSREDSLRAQALDAAEAGIERAIHFLRNGPPEGANDGTWRVQGYTEEMDDSRRFEFDVEDGSGDNTGRILIDSQGEATHGPRTQKRRMVAVVTRLVEDISVWDNVIFGGVGQSGRSINGNVVMRGKVHLLGDGEPYTDVDNDGK
jgi:type II secretory pathway component PulK